MKGCFKCMKLKPLDDFYKHLKMSDGHLNKCKECAKIDVQRNYAFRKDRYKAYELKREQRPRRKALKAGYQRTHRLKYVEKYKARTALNNALRDGRIKKKPCRCGSEKVQAHHRDYSKYLDVAWLCFKCHREDEHGQSDVVT